MTDTRPVVLKAEHLGITFGGLKAVSDFNMEIHEGELMGLIGPNGAGKTTVFNLLTGVRAEAQRQADLSGRGGRHCPHVPEHPPVQGHDGAR